MIDFLLPSKAGPWFRPMLSLAHSKAEATSSFSLREVFLFTDNLHHLHLSGRTPVKFLSFEGDDNFGLHDYLFHKTPRAVFSLLSKRRRARRNPKLKSTRKKCRFVITPLMLCPPGYPIQNQRMAQPIAQKMPAYKLAHLNICQ